MIDPRMTPANGRVAASFLEGEIEAKAYVDGEIKQCGAAAADIVGKPNGRRTSQILYGDLFHVLEERAGYAFGQSVGDGYCGYVRMDLLDDAQDATHWVASPQTHLYPGANMKLMTKGALYFGSEVAVESTEGTWSKLVGGLYVPSSHLLPVSTRLNDLVDIADLFLGTPYLWGGSTRYGIDCSGLIQLCCRACALECPRDSDMQEADLGRTLDPDTQLQRGDLVFWEGHVGIMASPKRLLHANSYHMSVAYEPLEEAKERIKAAGDGPVTSIKRIFKN